MKRRAAVLLTGALLGVLPASRSDAQALLPQLDIIAPAAPGGGWDQTARAMQQALQRSGIVRTPVVENIPGAAGTIGLARFMGAERGNGDAVMVSGLIMLGGIVTHQSPVTLADVTPIARISGEYEVIAVPAASPFMSLADVLSAFKARPESISWGGGSAGGSDQILAGLVAKAVGVDARRVNYIAFSGGGESLSAIIGGQVSVGINGLAEFAPHIESGALRALAISSGERLPGLAIPTLREQGVDIEFENWRSLVGPPGLTSDDKARLEAVVDAMVRSKEWREALERYRWIDRYLSGPPFAAFVDEEERRVRETLQALGTGGGGAVSLAEAGPYPLFVLAGLVVCGAGALVSLLRRRVQSIEASAAPVNAEPRAVKVRSLALVLVGVVLDVALAEGAGFVISSALLFWFAARAFDGAHPLRDALFAVSISVSAYLLFARVLQLSLPAGILAGVL